MKNRNEKNMKKNWKMILITCSTVFIISLMFIIGVFFITSWNNETLGYILVISSLFLFLNCVLVTCIAWATYDYRWVIKEAKKFENTIVCSHCGKRIKIKDAYKCTQRDFITDEEEITYFCDDCYEKLISDIKNGPRAFQDVEPATPLVGKEEKEFIAKFTENFLKNSSGDDKNI